MSNKANTAPPVETTDTAPAESPRHARRGTKNEHNYVHDVYDARYKHFRTLRLLSFVVGGSILLVLCFGMWRLYAVVVTTITDAQSLLTLTGPRSTSVIQFDTLERVRAGVTLRQQEQAIPLSHPLIPAPPTTTPDIQSRPGPD